MAKCNREINKWEEAQKGETVKDKTVNDVTVNDGMDWEENKVWRKMYGKERRNEGRYGAIKQVGGACVRDVW